VTNSVSGTTISTLVLNLMSAINADARLQGPEGVAAEDWFDGDAYTGQSLSTFNLRALSPGWNASQIQSVLSGSPRLYLSPEDSQPLNDYLSDLQPRAHLYLTCGASAFSMTFPFDTTAQADGFHELTAVLYEGSNVRTQRRVAQTVQIQNRALSAIFSTPFTGSNVAVEATLPFTITASSADVSSIELFSTGGSLGNVLGQSNAAFSVVGSNLEVGLHPFYAIVTAANGDRYRTETKWLRLVGAEPPILIRLTQVTPPVIAWPATPGRRYEILAAADLGAPFQVTASITPANTAASWTETNPFSPSRFYRVQTQY